MRLSEADEYAYSFAGKSAGRPTERPESLMGSMVEGAITDFFAGYSKEEIHQKLLKLCSGEEPLKSASFWR
jgi:hypothetical protein